MQSTQDTPKLGNGIAFVFRTCDVDPMPFNRDFQKGIGAQIGVVLIGNGVFDTIEEKRFARTRIDGTGS